MDGRTVLVRGGEVGRILAAPGLRAALPKTDRVLPVDRESRHLFQPALLWLGQWF
jgi:hypothetical protein